MQDNTLYLNNLILYLKDYHKLLPIIVLDNCDKRNKDEQLLMFQVAQWLRTTFKCIVLLPMRDSTYDQYKDEPPLDTVVKDLVFRIDPPDLLRVIQSRLDYIIRITTQTDSTYIGLLSNVTYLAACAEDTNFKNQQIMTTISKRIASSTQLSKLSIAMTAHDLIGYLIEYRKEFRSSPEIYVVNEDQIEIYNMEECVNALDKWLENDSFVKENFTALQDHPSSSMVVVEVVSQNSGALICRFGEQKELKGFISALDAKYGLAYEQYEQIFVGQYLECSILEYDWDHNSFQLKYLKTVTQ